MASITLVNGKWRALVRRKGFDAQCRTFAVKAKAEKWARDIETQIDGGALVRDSGEITLSAVIAAYRSMREGPRPVDDSSTEHYTLRQLDAGLGHLIAARMTPNDLAGYCRARADSGAGRYTCNMDISKLGTAMRYGAMSLDVKLPDVAKAARPLLTHLGLIGGGGKRERRPTEDEMHNILQFMEQGRGVMFADIVRLAVLTAMRQGELTRIRWSDIDAAKKLVLVRDRKDPRNKKGNHEWVPLLGDAWALVQRQPRAAHDERIFPIDGSTVSKYFTQACRALGIPDLHFHDLRHDGTSRLFERGMRIEQVALVTGHKDWRNLKRYTNLRPEDLHDKF